MTAFASPPSGRIIPAVWKLIRLRLLITFNGFKHSKPIRKVLTVVAVLGLLAFAAMILFVSWLLLGFLRSPELTQYVGMDVAPFLQAVPVLIFTVLFLGILLSSFGVLLQALYLSGDMDFLLSSPVPIRAVFVTKLLQAVLPNFGLISLFGLPVLFGLGLAGHYNFLYFPLVILTMIALALAASGLSALLVMLVARVFPARRAAEILGFVGGTLAFVCSQAGNIYNSFGRSAQVSGAQVNNMFSLMMRFNTPWLPLNWAGQGLVALGEGRWLTGLLLVSLTLGLSALGFVVALSTAERWYYSGWAGMQVISHKKKSPRSVRKPSGLESSLRHNGLCNSIPWPRSFHSRLHPGDHLERFPAPPPRPAQPVAIDFPAHLRRRIFLHVIKLWKSATCRTGTGTGMVYDIPRGSAYLCQHWHGALCWLDAAGAPFRHGFLV